MIIPGVSALALAGALQLSPSEGSPVLTSTVETIISAPAYERTSWGLFAIDVATGKVLARLNSDRFFAPGSVAKLYAASAALGLAGPDFRYHTAVYRLGAISQAGELTKPLVLVGSGDPSMGGRSDGEGGIIYRNHDHLDGRYGGTLTGSDALAGLRSLAKQVASYGIRRLSGGCVVDDRLFDCSSFSTMGASRPSAIDVNDNLMDISFALGPGQHVKAKLSPPEAGYPIEGDVRVSQTEGTDISAQLDRGVIKVAGTLNADDDDHIEVIPVANPAAFARRLFIGCLREIGVRVGATPLDSNPTELLSDASAYIPANKVAEIVSPPLSASIKWVLKVSANMHANELPFLLASLDHRSDFFDGIQKQKVYLVSIGVDPTTVSLSDGAGLDQADRVTPQGVVSLLLAIRKQSYYNQLKQALPILGVDGTLATASSIDDTAHGQVWAKTGTLLNYDQMNRHLNLSTKALAGYMVTAKGREIAFAIIANNIPLETYEQIGKHANTLATICSTWYKEFDQ